MLCARRVESSTPDFGKDEIMGRFRFGLSDLTR